MRLSLAVASSTFLAAALAAQSDPPPAAPKRPPGAEGRLAHTASYVIGKGQQSAWQKPAFTYDAKVATGRKHAKVIVVVYDPLLPGENGLPQHDGKRLRAHVGGCDPMHGSRVLVDVIRQA